MKISQNDLIISIVAIVLGIGFSAAFFFMKREPQALPAAAQVNLTPAALPAPGVQMANALPGAGNAGGGGMGGMAGGMPGGRGPGMMGGRDSAGAAGGSGVAGGPAMTGASPGGGPAGAMSAPGL